MSGTISPSAQNLLLGRGKLYFDRFTSGTTTKNGEVELGNVTTFEITTSDETKDKYESMDSSSGLYKSVVTKRTVEMKITGDEFSMKNLALAMMGVEGTLSQSTASITGEHIMAAGVKQGRWYPLSKRGAITSVTVKVSSTTKTITTDYLLDTVSGRVYIVPGGGISDGDDVTVDFTYPDLTLNKIAGAAQSLIEGYLRFKGDPAAGPKYEVEVWHAQVAPDGALGFIQDDFGNFSLKLKVLNDSANHASDPYYRVLELT